VRYDTEEDTNYCEKNVERQDKNMNDIIVELHNRIKIHTVYRMSSYRIQYSLAPITVYGKKKEVNFEKYE
jgi:hypothetical protein